MAQYIDKDALVAEIERRKQVAFGWMETAPNNAIEAEFELCDDILSFIDTLEVKEVDTEQLDKLLNWWKEVTSDYSAYKVKEVDLENELEEWIKYGPHTNYPWCTIPDAIKITAEHFFEFGMAVNNKAQKVE